MHSKTLLPIFVFLFVFNAKAQEREVPLMYNHSKALQHAMHRSDLQTQRGGGLIELPFFDDFSRYSLPTSLPGIPPQWQLWEDDHVFINTTFPVAPLTIGVATLEGLDAVGQPYRWDDEFASDTCDYLTSMPIDLGGYQAEDSIRLLFHYQCRGLGDPGEDNDTLYLDFYNPLGNVWTNVWKQHGQGSMTGFEQVFITITQSQFLISGFKFRFRNYGRPGGAVDHWHLDYVLLAEDINADNFQFDEVAFQYANSTLLSQNLQAMPWQHYVNNAAEYTAPSITISQRNLSPGPENITSQVKIFDQTGVEIYASTFDLNTAAAGNSEITRTISLNGFTFSGDADANEADFEICATFNQTDAQLQNDTMCFTQHFANYYAYDDGSAESGWGMNQAGSRTALRFNIAQPDTLIGVMMHWLPHLIDYSNESFLIRVYADNAGLPGAELNADDFNFYNYNYQYEGYNPFYYYELAQPIPIENTFYVGWIQQTPEDKYIGNDRNNNTNTQKLFRKLSPFDSWGLTAVEGAIMLRPVFRAGNQTWAGMDKQNLSNGLVLFPNPAEDKMNVLLPNVYDSYQMQITDMAGRVVMAERFSGNSQFSFDISVFTQGIYHLQLTSATTGHLYVSRFAKR